jgi:hypothetical protein
MVNPDWTDEENVFAFLEQLDEGRKLSEGDKELIRGQRQINRRFFDTINAILDVISPAAKASQSEVDSLERLAALRDQFQTVPGERPPGCAGPDVV